MDFRRETIKVMIMAMANRIKSIKARGGKAIQAMRREIERMPRRKEREKALEIPQIIRIRIAKRPPINTGITGNIVLGL